MPISDKDRELWRMVMQDVKPLQHDVVTPEPTCVPRINTQPHTTPSHTWDLHGMTLQDAHALVQSEISQSQHTFKYMTFITGKSGQMQKEFSNWLSQHAHVHRCEPLNGGGAYRIWFKKTRHKQK
jgi:DNA-nicking Smr family endonuclease